MARCRWATRSFGCRVVSETSGDRGEKIVRRVGQKCEACDVQQVRFVYWR